MFKLILTLRTFTRAFIKSVILLTLNKDKAHQSSSVATGK